MPFKPLFALRERTLLYPNHNFHCSREQDGVQTLVFIARESTIVSKPLFAMLEGARWRSNPCFYCASDQYCIETIAPIARGSKMAFKSLLLLRERAILHRSHCFHCSREQDGVETFVFIAREKTIATVGCITCTYPPSKSYKNRSLKCAWRTCDLIRTIASIARGSKMAFNTLPLLRERARLHGNHCFHCSRGQDAIQTLVCVARENIIVSKP